MQIPRTNCSSSGYGFGRIQTAFFLVQKTPLLDVQVRANRSFGLWMRFSDGRTLKPQNYIQLLERLKVVPSLHVMVVRHPMSYAHMHDKIGAELYPYIWLDSWNHVLTGLSGVEWYAVVTYEALVLYHDQVVRELVEVVRSGVARYNGTSHHAAETGRHRKLNLHLTKDDPATYLDLGKATTKNWERCCDDKKCLRTLESLTGSECPRLCVSLLLTLTRMIKTIQGYFHTSATSTKTLILSRRGLRRSSSRKTTGMFCSLRREMH